MFKDICFTCHDPEYDAPPAQTGDPKAVLLLQVVAQHDDRGHAQSHQEERVERGLNQAQPGAGTRECKHLENHGRYGRKRENNL